MGKHERTQRATEQFMLQLLDLIFLQLQYRRRNKALQAQLAMLVQQCMRLCHACGPCARQHANGSRHSRAARTCTKAMYFAMSSRGFSQSCLGSRSRTFHSAHINGSTQSACTSYARRARACVYTEAVRAQQAHISKSTAGSRHNFPQRSHIQVTM